MIDCEFPAAFFFFITRFLDLDLLSEFQLFVMPTPRPPHMTPSLLLDRPMMSATKLSPALHQALVARVQLWSGMKSSAEHLAKYDQQLPLMQPRSASNDEVRAWHDPSTPLVISAKADGTAYALLITMYNDQPVCALVDRQFQFSLLDAVPLPREFYQRGCLFQAELVAAPTWQARATIVPPPSSPGCSPPHLIPTPPHVTYISQQYPQIEAIDCHDELAPSALLLIHDVYFLFGREYVGKPMLDRLTAAEAVVRSWASMETPAPSAARRITLWPTAHAKPVILLQVKRPLCLLHLTDAVHRGVPASWLATTRAVEARAGRSPTSTSPCWSLDPAEWVCYRSDGLIIASADCAVRIGRMAAGLWRVKQNETVDLYYRPHDRTWLCAGETQPVQLPAAWRVVESDGDHRWLSCPDEHGRMTEPVDPLRHDLLVVECWLIVVSDTDVVCRPSCLRLDKREANDLSTLQAAQQATTFTVSGLWVNLVTQSDRRALV